LQTRKVGDFASAVYGAKQATFFTVRVTRVCIAGDFPAIVDGGGDLMSWTRVTDRFSVETFSPPARRVRNFPLAMCCHVQLYEGVCVQCFAHVTRKRLLCVLDLDHTLVHAAPNAVTQLAEPLPAPATHRITYPILQRDGMTRLHTQDICVRPGAEALLRDLHTSGAYELHVSTLGSRNYALAILDVLDPTEQFVPRGCIVARENASLPQTKQLGDVFAARRYALENGDDDTDDAALRARTCIVDDRLDVWAADKSDARVLQVLPFEAFALRRPADTCLPPRVSQGGRDNVLATVARVLDALAQLFWACESTISMTSLMEKLRAGILARCVLAFSGVVPLGVDPTCSDAWVRATAMGARCIEPSTDAEWASVTHLVCAATGSSKWKHARRMRTTTIVSPDWLYASVAAWKRADECAHPVGTRTEPLWTRTPTTVCALFERFVSRVSVASLDVVATPPPPVRRSRKRSATTASLDDAAAVDASRRLVIQID
jgi:hypothetical protein